MNSTQIELLHQAHEYLRSARLLFNQGRYALAAPRAQDAAFLVVEALLAGQGLEFPGREELAAAFDEQFASTGLTPPALHAYVTQAAQPQSDQVVARSDAAIDVERAEQFLDLAHRLIGTFPDDEGDGDRLHEPGHPA